MGHACRLAYAQHGRRARRRGVDDRHGIFHHGFEIEESLDKFWTTGHPPLNRIFRATLQFGFCRDFPGDVPGQFARQQMP